MPKHAQRVRLESGLKLDVNRLVRRGLTPPLGSTVTLCSSVGQLQRRACRDCQPSRGAADCARWGSCTVDMNGRKQRISLEASPRHYGGMKWYFICPVMNRRISVLWMPPGAHTFASRQRWGRQVAYSSQFCDRTDRAHHGKARINARLCAIGSFDPKSKPTLCSTNLLISRLLGD